MASPHRARLLELGVPDLAETWSKFGLLADLWTTYRHVINITGKEALEIHVEEAVLAWRLGRRHAAAGIWVDVGSGGGLPGLVWAALGVPSLLLVEPRPKRAAFLEMACGRLGRPDAVVAGCRLEDLERRQYALVSARAVWNPENWLERAASLEAGVVLVHDRDGGPGAFAGWEVLGSSSHQGLRVVALRST